jgi:ribosomal protein L39E
LVFGNNNGEYMAKHKTSEKKEFLIAERKKTGASATNAPVWVMQKAGKRIWNKKGKRHWRSTTFGYLFKKKQASQGKAHKKFKSGKHKKSARPSKHKGR